MISLAYWKERSQVDDLSSHRCGTTYCQIPSYLPHKSLERVYKKCVVKYASQRKQTEILTRR